MLLGFRGITLMNIRLVKTGLFFIMIAMLLSFAFAAQSFTVSTEAVDNRIFSDEVAEFSFNLQNFDVVDDRFTIFTTNPSWNIYFDGSLVSLSEKETKSVRVIIDPTSGVAEGNIYSIPLTVKSLNDDEEITVSVDITLDSNEIRTYNPSIFVDVVVGSENVINPMETVPLSVRFINKNSLDIPALTVRINSELITDTFTIPLGPNQEVTKLLSYEFDPQTIPGEKSLDVSLFIDEKQSGTQSRFMYNVAQSTPPISRKIVVDSDSESPLFLKTLYGVELTNNGNIAQTETFLYKLSWWQGLFTSATTPTAFDKINGDRHAIYDITLGPGETTSISIETNYRLFTLIFVIILAIVLGSIFSYYFFRAPIVIKKRVIVVGEVSDGVSRLKVILDIKNRTGKLLKNIRVIERAPTITEVEDDFTLGTLAPSKVIKNASRGTLIRWDFATIEPYEERLITYTIRSKLSILGELKLPSTIVKYERFGHTQTVKETIDKDDDES